MLQYEIMKEKIASLRYTTGMVLYLWELTTRPLRLVRIYGCIDNWIGYREGEDDKEEGDRRGRGGKEVREIEE